MTITDDQNRIVSYYLDTMGQPHEVHYWTKHFGISKDDLQRAIEKVGTSAAAVRKELGLIGEAHK